MSVPLSAAMAKPVTPTNVNANNLPKERVILLPRKLVLSLIAGAALHGRTTSYAEPHSVHLHQKMDTSDFVEAVVLFIPEDHVRRDRFPAIPRRPSQPPF